MYEICALKYRIKIKLFSRTEKMSRNDMAFRNIAFSNLLNYRSWGLTLFSCLGSLTNQVPRNILA
jgi:hypothetical protein